MEMNFNEENPVNPCGRDGQSSSAEVLKQLMTELGALLHAHPQHGGIVINYYNSVGQRIDSVNTQNFATDKWLETPKLQETTTTQEIPRQDVMTRAVEKTLESGYWWATTAWAVVYRIYQMKGYTGGIMQFVRDVKEWPWTKKLRIPCTYDSVQKPIVSGKLARSIDKWKEDGASEQMVKLGQTLLDLLN